MRGPEWPWPSSVDEGTLGMKRIKSQDDHQGSFRLNSEKADPSDAKAGALKLEALSTYKKEPQARQARQGLVSLQVYAAAQPCDGRLWHLGDLGAKLGSPSPQSRGFESTPMRRGLGQACIEVLLTLSGIVQGGAKSLDNLNQPQTEAHTRVCRF